jgi:hypothetical protein
MDTADGLIEAAEATGNPMLLAWTLGAYGAAFRDADPVGALNALGRSLVIAQDSGNRAVASAGAPFLARLEAEHGGTVSAFDHLTLAIRNYHDSGDTTTIRGPLAALAALFDRLGRYEPAATIAGFALSPIAAAAVPEITTAIAHLRDVLNTPVECPSGAEALGEGVGVQKSVRAPYPHPKCRFIVRPRFSLSLTMRSRIAATRASSAMFRLSPSESSPFRRGGLPRSLRPMRRLIWFLVEASSAGPPRRAARGGTAASCCPATWQTSRSRWLLESTGGYLVGPYPEAR